MWTETNKKWEGRCFSFNPISGMKKKALINIDIISSFSSDLEIRFHAENQTTDKELDGTILRARHGRRYNLDVHVDIIIISAPCLAEDFNFDEIHRGVALDKMIAEVGCIVPFIKRNKVHHQNFLAEKYGGLDFLFMVSSWIILVCF